MLNHAMLSRLCLGLALAAFTIGGLSSLQDADAMEAAVGIDGARASVVGTAYGAGASSR